LIIANWKMNLSLSDALVLSGQIAGAAEKLKNIEVVIAPPAIYLYPIKEHLKAKSENLHLCAQDVFYQDEGAFTGEISALMIKNICSFSIIGHSERRKYFGETDEIISRKLKTLLKNNMKAIICVGENEKYHLEDHFNYEVKRMKLSDGIISSAEKILSGIAKSQFKNIVLAYEPIWAIGTCNNASASYTSSVCYILKSHLTEKFGEAVNDIRVIYGGSTSAQNTSEYMSQPNIDGLLVGSSSLSSKEFNQICREASEKIVK